MGFLDKAKKMAEQAQAKLDEVQQQLNDTQSGTADRSGPPVEYDKHGRPIPSAPPATASPPQGDPLADSASLVSPGGPSADPGAPAAGTSAAPGGDRPHGDPLGDVPPGPAPAATAPPSGTGTQPPAEDRNHPSYAPPKLTSGDPLAG